MAKIAALVLNWSIILTIAISSYFATALDNLKERTNKPQNERLNVNGIINELDYKNYLAEVVELLRSDDKFNPKHFSDMNVIGLKSGNFAKHLRGLPRDIRSKLDEAKRLELDRIRKLGEELLKRGHKESEVQKQVKRKSRHLDIDQISTFDKEDLRRLIVQTNEEIAYVDKLRKETFKIYEMQKQLEFEELMKRLSPEMKKKVEKNVYDLYLRHRRAKPIHMPGSKIHLLTVWEEHDRMSKENFNAETFFRLHDLDNNGLWDEPEINILNNKEASPHYDKNEKDFDPKEKQEEIDRMREYTFGEMDKDVDHLVSLDEFIEYSKSIAFENKKYWDPLGNSPFATDEEYAKHVTEHQAETVRMIEAGLIKLPLSGIVTHEDINDHYLATNTADALKLNQL
ncbi:Nucleobindin-1 [Orchesella cincta]|uniref:Nucleobindin-1 n=1 Tax=Orchesella cincta TaxID=48709 RepID=A0A1D2NKG0_ORCCI|nr:Nucleobindin-1 [Orchesella cincta]